MQLRLKTIQENATKNVSFNPSEIQGNYPDYYVSPTLSRLEDDNTRYNLNPVFENKTNVFAFDESIQNYSALEGDLLFYSSAVIKVDKKYLFDLQVVPHFISSMSKFENMTNDSIHFADKHGNKRNEIMIKSKVSHILNSVEPSSLVLIDGPLIGGNASHYYMEMDNKLREKDCIPIYFVKNSKSRLIIENDDKLKRNYNSDFHWASSILRHSERTPFFKYTDQKNQNNSKVFSYLKVLRGFPERIELHSRTFQKYAHLLDDILNLIAYYFIAQGDYANPQVRPIAIAEKYAREGIKMLNIPVLLGKMGFHPTINQVRFG